MIRYHWRSQRLQLFIKLIIEREAFASASMTRPHDWNLIEAAHTILLNFPVWKGVFSVLFSLINGAERVHSVSISLVAAYSKMFEETMKMTSEPLFKLNRVLSSPVFGKAHTFQCQFFVFCHIWNQSKISRSNLFQSTHVEESIPKEARWSYWSQHSPWFTKVLAHAPVKS